MAYRNSSNTDGSGNRVSCDLDVEKKSCKTCRYFHDSDGKASRCVRFPPQWITPYDTDFPLVKKDSYCGEYKKGK